MHKARANKPLIVRNPSILGGKPVFAGTRVPVAFLFEYLEAGDSLDVFLEGFPSVRRAQAVAVLAAARKGLLVVEAKKARRKVLSTRPVRLAG